MGDLLACIGSFRVRDIELSSASLRLRDAMLQHSSEVGRTELEDHEVDAACRRLGLSVVDAVALLRAGVWRRLDAGRIDVAAR